MRALALVCLLFLMGCTVSIAGVEVNNHLLLNAINANDVDQLTEVLRDTSRKQLNKKGNGGQTPLMFAAMSGKDKAVLPLLDAGF